MKVVNRILGEAMTPYQRSIYMDPEQAFYWAHTHDRRFPEAEPYIAKDAQWATEYALLVIKGRWPEAEPTILKKPSLAASYAMNVINGRWPEAEEVIATHPEWAYLYAINVINGRWPEAEKRIAIYPQLALEYAEWVVKGRWPEGEKAIANSEYKDYYLEKFPDAKEDWMLKGWLDWLDT